MRMSRIRQRRLLLQQRRQDSHNRQKAAAAVLGSLVVSVPQQSNAALNVLQDINNDFDYMQDSLESINAYDAAKDWVVDAVNNAALAQQYLDEAIQTCRDADENLLQAQDNQKQAEEILAETEKELTEARANRIELTQQAIASQQAVADYLPTWYEAQAQLQQCVDVQEAAAVDQPYSAGAGGGWTASDEQRAQWIQEAWAEVGYESNRLPEIEARFSGEGNGYDAAEAQAEQDAYWERMAELDREVEEAREYFDSVSEYLDELKAQQLEAEEAEADARQNVIELQIEVAQNKQDVLDCIQDVKICTQERDEAITNRQQAVVDLEEAHKDVDLARFGLLHFGEGMGAQKSLEYYSWQGPEGRSGHQLYSGNSFYWSKNHYDFSLSNAYVMSNTGLAGGEMSGVTDTSLTAMYTNKHPVYDVRYGLEVNLPTGSSRTNNNAVVPDYLARVSRLGEGWNFTPRLEVVRHLDKYTSMTWRGSYSFRGAYEEDYDGLTGNMHPGNQWTNELEYLHTDKKTHYMLKFQYTNNSDKSSISGTANDYSFTEGDGLGLRGYYRSWFTPKDSWGAYGAWTFDGGTAYDNGLASGSGVHRLYYGAGYFHQFDSKRQLRLFANWLRADGESYDPLTRLTSASGRRFSVSLGYDWRMDDKNSLSLDMERGILRQQGDANYRSWGVMLNYNRSF